MIVDTVETTIEDTLRRVEHVLRVLSVCVATLGFAVVAIVFALVFT